jgi:PhzF family phenazine biosynthesis protein
LVIADAFTDTAFSGNPAAVCLLQSAPTEHWMGRLAAELNLPMTAFVVTREDDDYDLRWFTPTVEVDICGHATLAACHVLGRSTRFHTRSGVLACVLTATGLIDMDFPAFVTEPISIDKRFIDALGISPELVRGMWAGGEWHLIELDSPRAVRALAPDFGALRRLGGVVIAVAEPGDQVGIDSVCRVFEPASGIDEDPVTGSAHCVIGPWLQRRTGRSDFRGEQVSRRGGVVEMSVAGGRVALRGSVVTIVDGRIAVEP